jgi:hypothetical protein
MAGGLHHCHYPGAQGRLTRGLDHQIEHSLPRRASQLAEQLAVVEEVQTQHLCL